MGANADPGLKNVQHQPHAKLREPIVLVTIICLSLMCGTNFIISHQTIRDMDDYNMRELHKRYLEIGPVFAAVLIAFLSELNGRKLVFNLLFALSALSSVLLAFPRQIKCLSCGIIVQTVVIGGSFTMTSLAISEYSSPEHRLTYLIANAAVFEIGSEAILHTPYVTAILSNECTVYIQTFQVLLGLACLVSVRAWPESPYWLASKVRLEESKGALLWVRGQGPEWELHASAGKRHPKLYCKALFIAILLISINAISFMQEICYVFTLSVLVLPRFIELCVALFVLFIIALLSYVVKRKVLYLTCCAVPLVLQYVIAMRVFGGFIGYGPPSSLFDLIFHITDILRNCGINCLTLALFIELIPHKYNTQISCIYTVFCFLAKYFLWFTIGVYSRIPDYANILLLTTPVLVLVILVYWLAPETKDKSLLEIQDSYTGVYESPDQNILISPGQDGI